MPYYHWGHTYLGGPPCHQGYGNIWTQAAAQSHICVPGPSSIGVCADLYSPRNHRGPQEPRKLKSKGLADPALSYAGTAGAGPVPSLATATEELALPFKGELAPHSEEMVAPINTDLESWLHPSPEEGGPRGPSGQD